MFKTAYRLPFTLFGIPIKLDVTFVFLIVFLTWAIGSQVDLYIQLFRIPVDVTAVQAGLTPWILGLVSALGLVLSVLVHELGHALTARRYGVEVKEITLWILGGVAQLREMPQQRGAEAVVAIVGPIVSVVVAGIFFALFWFAGPAAGLALFVFGYLAVVNFFLAVFNMLPALPLDGGRVLRSLLALRMGQFRATRFAAVTSQVIAILLGIFAILPPTNIFMLAIAFFVYMGARGETQYAFITQALEDIRVRDIMTRDVVTVEPQMPVEQFIKLMFFKKHLGYPVVDEYGRLLGIVKLHHAENAPDNAVVGDIMTKNVHAISERESAVEAFKRMGQDDIGRLVVVDGNSTITGILSKTDLTRAIQIRMIGSDTSGEPIPPQDLRRHEER